MLFLFLALQEMLPTIMSQMGITSDSGLVGEAGRRRFGARGDQQTGHEQSRTTNDQAGAEADDEEVPGMLKKKLFLKTFYRCLFYLKILWKILMKYQIRSNYIIFIIINKQHFKCLTVVFCDLFLIFFAKEDNKNKRKKKRKKKNPMKQNLFFLAE